MQSFSSIDAKAVNENQTQPRSQSSSAISDVTSPVKLVEKVRQGLGSKPPLVTRIARTGQGTRLNQTHSSVENTENTMKMIEQEDFVVTSRIPLTSWTFLSLLILRWKKPHDLCPYKVWIGIPVVMLVVSCCLVIAPLLAKPQTSAVALVFVSSVVPVYLLFVDRSK